jgi:hypothetical protein
MKASNTEASVEPFVFEPPNVVAEDLTDPYELYGTTIAAQKDDKLRQETLRLEKVNRPSPDPSTTAKPRTGPAIPESGAPRGVPGISVYILGFSTILSLQYSCI